jgi:hypothetical protein
MDNHLFKSSEDKIKFDNLKDKQIKNFINSKVYSSLKELNVKVDNNKIKVFAKKNFMKGELIECSPLIPLNFRSNYHHDPNLNYKIFKINRFCTCTECAKHGHVLAMAGGYASIYNISNDPNSVWYDSFENLLWFNLALKDIKRGEEITIYKDINTKSRLQNKEEIDLETFDWSRIPLTPTD